MMLGIIQIGIVPDRWFLCDSP